MEIHPLLIFSDLDGTLLGHQNYGFDAALEALGKIGRNKTPLILNSSKTRSEMLSIRKKMHNNHPFVVENGAAIYVPSGIFSQYSDDLTELSLGVSRKNILQFIHQLRDQKRYSFKGFADFTLDELIAETGLSKQQAEQARDRTGSEPIKWLDTEENLQFFKQAIEQQGLKLLKGGRFLHVMGQTDKAKAMRILVDLYRNEFQQDYKTIAMGDSQNDKLMLEQADFSGIIKPEKGSELEIEKEDNVYYSTLPAPKGWQEVMNKILNLIESKENR